VRVISGERKRDSEQWWIRDNFFIGREGGSKITMRLKAYPAIVYGNLVFLFIVLLRIGPVYKAAGEN